MTTASNAHRMTPAQMRGVQLEILGKIDAFCRRQGIRYYLWAGTLLGAVRHGGYIPWDDDIDIAMPRPDYERFCRSFAARPTSDLFLYEARTDGDYGYPFARVSDQRTTIVERSPISRPIGVNVDVFPLDGWPRGWIATRLQRWRLALLHGTVAVWASLPNRNRSFGKGLLLAIARPAVTKIPVRTLTRLISRTAQTYQFKECEFVGGVSWRTTSWRNTERVEASAYGAPTDLQFEGQTYPGPTNPDRVLTNFFGDYMTLPPEKERKKNRHAWDAFWLEQDADDETRLESGT